MSLSQIPFNIDFKETLQKNTLHALMKLDQFTLINCEGPDALVFLQGQLTCDVESLQTSGGGLNFATLGSCCTPQGRMVSVFHIAKISSTEYWLFLPKANAAHCLNHLKKYSIFSKVTLTENPEEFKLYGLITANSNSPVPHRNTELKVFPLQDINRQLYIIACPQSQDININAVELSEKFWNLALLLSGIPVFDASLSGEYLPADLHFDALGGVSYNKGCYTGQEPIARMHFKGKAKFFCQLAKWPLSDFNGEAGINMDNDKKGQIVRFISTDNENIGLIRVRIDCFEHLKNNSLLLTGFQQNAELVKLAYNTERQIETMQGNIEDAEP